MNVLFQTRINPEFIKHVENIQKDFPEETEITYAKATVNKVTFESIRFMLNYYEFIAVGIKHGDLDEKLMKDCICSQMCKFCRRCDDFIRTVRNENQFGTPAADKARLLCSLRPLQRKWQAEIDRDTLHLRRTA
jgi:Domain of unknown function (DUF4760)